MTDGTPTLISGRPNDAVGVTTRRSHARASSNAAPRQYPLIGGDSDDWRVPDSAHDLREIADQGVRSGRCQTDEGLDVHSGAEGRLARAGKDNRLHAGRQAGDDVAKLAQVLRMQDVELLRPVEGDPEGTAAVFCLDVPHVLLLPSVGTIGPVARRRVLKGARASQGPQSSTSLLTVAQLRAVPPTGAEVGPPFLASTRRNSLRGYPSGVCR